MTVSTTLSKVTYPGSGAQTTFSFSFAFPGGTATQEAANIQVYYTDTLGNITLLTAGPGATQYQISFNPASGTNPTPVGGTVTYNPNSVPIPLGTSLTILRSLPLTQATSLQNQGTLYQPVTEAALDYEMMVSQQVLEVQSRALVVPVSDPTPGVLPSVAARKNGVLGFDSQGNPITVLTAPAGTISGVMQPVVSAASLAAGRTAFGLGAAATEGIGAGLADDGSGNLRVFFQESGIATPQSVGSSNHLFRYLCFSNITFTIARANTLFNGFGFWVTTQGFTATLSINAADTFFGASTGQSLVIGPGQTVYITTDTVSTWFADFGVPISHNAAVNLQINASVAASALTIALKDRNGNDPSATSPVIVGFRDSTVANGGPIARAVAAPLSITIPSGATLGTVNGLANRIWLALFDNAGSLVLGVYNTLFNSGGTLAISSWDETTPISTTAISAGSINSQTWYTQGGALTNKSFRILGYVESTQPTAGTWTVAPSKIQLFGPGVKKPGDVVQNVQSGASSLTITPLSASSLVKYIASLNVNLTNATTTVSWKRAAATILSTSVGVSGVGIGVQQLVSASVIDAPNTTSAVTYSIAAGAGGTAVASLLEEIFI